MPTARLTVHVQPNAKRSQIVNMYAGVVRVRVSAPAQEGRANRALLELLANALGVPRSRIRVLRGASSRDKVLEVEGLTQDEAAQRLALV